MKIDLADLRHLIDGALMPLGLDEEDRRVIANEVLWTASRKDSRMNPVEELCIDIEGAMAVAPISLSVVSDRGAVRMVDLNGCPGILFLPQLISDARQLLQQFGVAVVGIRNTGGVHTLSTWVHPLAEMGYPTIFMWNGGSYTVAPFGSSEPYFGTNPIAYAFKDAQSNVLVADMASSEAPFMDVRHGRASGETLRPGAGLDASGNPTSDPKSIYDPSGDDTVRLLPMGGGYKGSVIMLLLEVLTGALVGGKMGRAATDDPFTPSEFGGLLVAFDPAAFGARESFSADLSALFDDLRQARVRPGYPSVSLPGDREQEREREAWEKGSLNLPTETMARLSGLSKRS